MKTFLILLLFTGTAFSQWPGFFYTFSLTDGSGTAIDSASKNYEMTAIKTNDKTDIMLSIKTCSDHVTWKFYEGGYDIGDVEKLKITKLDNNETMTIVFPSSLSGGKEKYYRNLYAGVIIFKKGTYEIKLPKSDNEWDGLKEKDICPLSYMTTTYYDISGFQDQK